MRKIAQLTELTISLQRGLERHGETTEAQVSATFKIQKGDGDLSRVVEEKFQEVRAALIQALESEPYPHTVATQNGISKVEGIETNTVTNLAGPVQNNAGEGNSEEEKEATTQEPALDHSVPLTEPAMNGPKATAAQKRTVESLRQSARIDDSQFRAMLETSFNCKTIEDLTKREAASLILQLSQQQRHRIIGDKPELTNTQSFQKPREETLSRNGSTG